MTSGNRNLATAVGTIVIYIVLAAAPARLLAVTKSFRVTSEAELSTATHYTGSEDTLDILVANDIDATSSIYFPDSPKTIYLHGTIDWRTPHYRIIRVITFLGATILIHSALPDLAFDPIYRLGYGFLIDAMGHIPIGRVTPPRRVRLRFVGDTFVFRDWSAGAGAGNGRNGIEFHCRNAEVSDLELTGFDHVGSVVAAFTNGSFRVHHCWFHDSGTMAFPRRPGSMSTGAADTVYNQCISAQDRPAGSSIQITDNYFTHCALSTVTWSHCLYISAPMVTVSHNSFFQCGNPMTVGSDAVPGAMNAISDNTFTAPSPTRDPGSSMPVPPFLSSIARQDHMTFTHNKIAGLWRNPWTGAFSEMPMQHHIDENDYGAMMYCGDGWGSDTRVGMNFTYDQWKTLGFDRSSTPPAPHVPCPPAP